MVSREYADQHVPGGTAAVQRNVDTGTAAFFDQIFLGSTMYDVMPVIAFSAAAAKLVDLPHMEFVKRISVWQAEHDLQGVYKLFVRALPPEAVALRLPKLALKYFDFGEATTKMLGERCCLAELRGIPMEIESWVQACIYGYVPVALGLAGAKSVRLRRLELDPSSPAEPGTGVIRIELRWT